MGFLMLQAQTLRNIQYALRSSVAFLIAYLVSKQIAGGDSAIIWIVPLMSVLLLQDTYGGTLMSGIIILFLYLPIVLFLYICQVHFGVGYHDYASSTVVFVVLTFLIGYYNKLVQIRKMLLLLPAVIIPTWVRTKPAELPDGFTWGLFLAVMLAVAIDIAVSLLILPRFATLELLDRASFTAMYAKEVLYLSREGLCAKQRAYADILLRRADDIAKPMLHNQEMLHLRFRAQALEPSRLLRRVFRRNQRCYARLNQEDILAFSSHVLLHSFSFTHAVAQIEFNMRHSDLMKEIKPAMDATFSSLSDILSHLIGEECQYEQNELQIDTLIDQAMINSKKLYANLRDFMEKNPFISSDSGIESSGNDGAGGSSSSSSSSSSGGGVRSGAAATVPVKKTTSVRRSQDTSTKALLSYDLTAQNTDGANRLAFSFFIFHIAELIKVLQSTFHSQRRQHPQATRSTPPPAVAPPASPIIRVLRLLLIIPPTDWRERLIVGWHTTVLCGIGLIFVQVPALARAFEGGQFILLAMIMSQSDNVGGTIAQMRLRLLGTMAGAIYAYFIYVVCGTRIYLGMTMFLPFLFVCSIIKQNQAWSYFGTVCITTSVIMWLGRVAFGDDLDSDFAMQRVQQNAIGVLLAAFAGMLTVPQLASDLLKLQIVSVLQTYKESIFKVFKAYEVVNVRSSALLSIDEDIEKGLEGNSISLAPVSPFQSPRPLQGEQPTLDHVDESPVPIERQNSNISLVWDPQLGTWRSSVRTHILAQMPLIDQANTEFMLFRPSVFPAEKYEQLIIQQRRVMLLLLSLESAVNKFEAYVMSKLEESTSMQDVHIGPGNGGSGNVGASQKEIASTVGQLLLLIRSDVQDLVRITVDCLHKWSKIFFESMLLHDFFSDGTMKAALQHNSFFVLRDEYLVDPAVGVNADANTYSYESLAGSADLSLTALESRGTYGDSASGPDRYAFAHATDIALLHALASRLATNSTQLNMALLTASKLGVASEPSQVAESDRDVDKGSNSEDPTVRSPLPSALNKAFDIVCAANGLLYSATHLARTVGAVGELVVSILTHEARATRIKTF